jgi:hypothetical protein
MYICVSLQVFQLKSCVYFPHLPCPADAIVLYFTRYEAPHGALLVRALKVFLEHGKKNCRELDGSKHSANSGLPNAFL